MFWKSIKTLFLFFCFFATNIFASTPQRSALESGFLTPPDSTKPALYWYWMNEHVSKEGITKDLEAMARVGIGEAFIGNIYEGGVPGKIKTLSPEWKECMQHAIREGQRLGIGISIFNSPGWSQSGGPWISPKESMRYLTYSSVSVEGGKKINAYLPKPKTDFQDVAVLAYPRKNDFCIKYKTAQSNHKTDKIDHLFDTDLSTKCTFKNEAHDSIIINIYSPEKFTARSLSIYPSGQAFNTTCKIQKKDGNGYRTIRQVYFDRSNLSLQLGPTPAGPMVLTFADESSDAFRIVLTDLPANFELSEIRLSSAAKIEKITEKLLNKLPNTSNPTWNAYMWPYNPLSEQKEFISEKEVIDISSYLLQDTLTWNAPSGDWNIIRIGMVPTGTTNTPAAPIARGLEIDKLSKTASQKHFDSFVGNIMQGLSKEELKALKRLIVDSYEVGPQNWTDRFREIFTSSMGYDPTPWLPVLTGDVIGSEKESNRFLWDMRRVIANLVAEEYVGGLRDIAHKNNMTLWLENYGHWGYPSEFLYYGSFSDDIGGEFWAGSPPSSECKLASSACHIYGKNKVYAESYTAGGRSFMWNPKELRKKGDWSYVQGANQPVLHVYIHQPYSDKTPGVNAWFGIEFNRHNTWFEQSKAWIDYQRRCAFMLQQGLPANDVCFFIGEDAPTMEGWNDKNLSSGYSYDFINADVIMNRVSVKNGKLCLPNGMQYSLLVLPPLETMRPELLKKIKELVMAGAVISGNPPKHSPSLANYPACDEEVSKLALDIWGKNELKPEEQITKKLGKGLVYANTPVNDVLKELNIAEDVKSGDPYIQWIHRRLPNGDLYFLTNQGENPVQTEVSFRCKNKQPELWDAVTGSRKLLNSFTNTGELTTLPLSLDTGESCFIVFLDNSKQTKENSVINPVVEKTVQPIIGPWTIRFCNNMLDQDFSIKSDTLFDWSKSSDEKIKYFSGTASYTTHFKAPQLAKGESLSLRFGDIQVIGTVYLNGQEVSTLWTPPYITDITRYIQREDNKLEVRVSNLWVNQLISQSKKPEETRDTWTLINAANPDQPLMPSGIVGPVELISTSNK